MEYTDALLIPVIFGLVELSKNLGVSKKYSPIVSLILGIIGGVVYIYPEDIRAGILMGIIMGLSAVGLYSGSKTFIQDSSKFNKDNSANKGNSQDK